MKAVWLIIYFKFAAVLQNGSCKVLPTKEDGLRPFIVGGIAATQDQFPHQLALKVNGRFSCGASLAEVDGQQIALTAAQCITASIIQYSLVGGEYNLEETSGLEQARDILRIYIYPSYSNNAPFHGDIAVLFLTQPFQLNDNVQPISLPEGGKSTEGNITVSGWGRLWDEGPFPNLLHYVSIPVVNNTECKAAWGGLGSEIIDGQLCAGEHTGGVSPCNGDTGGPAISEDGYLAGIVSWGWGCGHPEYPGIFTKVSEYIDWIHGTVTDFRREYHT